MSIAEVMQVTPDIALDTSQNTTRYTIIRKHQFTY